uniref:Ig-like domain-containing protein n=1 Tax=Cyclopterus lumpus TaxID=8103 RepID=A0A8C3AJL7_CYCLU
PLGEQLIGVKVFVKEGSDASLPCSLTEDVTAALFDWRKVAHGDQQQKEVFFHQAASHYNNGLRGQNEEFKGRVSFFEDELKHGNASIVIRNAKMADDGNYTCAFPLLQTPQIFYVELVVGEALDAGGDRSLLHCEVRGASPEPKVEWQDGHGNPLPAEAQVSETGSGYDVTVNVTVNKTDLYRCVVEQEAIKHRIAAETFVHICGEVSSL